MDACPCVHKNCLEFTLLKVGFPLLKIGDKWVQTSDDCRAVSKREESP